MAKVCIICSQEKSGSMVLDDAVIKAIRGIKKRFGMAKGNTLVVCALCMEKHKEKRRKYERDLVIHVVIAGIVLVVFVLAPIFTSGFSLSSLVAGLLLAALIIGLSVFSYSPKIAEDAKAAAQKDAKEAKENKKGKKK